MGAILLATAKIGTAPGNGYAIGVRLDQVVHPAVGFEVDQQTLVGIHRGVITELHAVAWPIPACATDARRPPSRLAQQLLGR